jgi:predicted deacylase
MRVMGVMAAIGAEDTAEAAPRFELATPELGRWRMGNTGVEGLWRFDSRRPGREVLVTSLVHGNELCGAHAVLAALEAGLRPVRGTLSLAFCNLDAFDRFDPQQPDATRFVDTDMNRLWGAMPWRASAAAASRALLREESRVLALAPHLEGADWLLDLHSMHEPGPPLGLVGPHGHHARAAVSMGAPTWLVADAGHAAGTRLRDHGRLGASDAVETVSLLVECGWHGHEASRLVALDMLARFLAASGVVDTAQIPAHWCQADPAPPRLLSVTHAIAVADSGHAPRFERRFATGERIAKAGTVIGFDGRSPVLTPYDDCVLVMPSLKHATPGATLVRLAHEVPI